MRPSQDTPPDAALPPPDLYRHADPAQATPGPTEGWFGAGFGGRTVWTGLVVALAIIFLLTIAAVGALEAVEPNASDQEKLWASFLTTLVVDLLALVALPILLLGGGRRALSRLGLRRPAARDLGWGILGLVGAMAVVWVYVGIVEIAGVEDLEPVSSIDNAEIYASVSLVVLTGILVVLVAPIAEEIFYRGFLFAGLGRRFGVVAGVLASSALFSAVHFDPGSLIPFGVVGIVFALIYWRSRSLNGAILAHGLFNAISFVALIFDRGVG